MRIGDQQRHLFRRGDQNVRRMLALAQALGVRRVAGAGFNRDGQGHLGHRCLEVAGDVDGQGLQWRNVKRVDAAALFPLSADLDQAGEKSGQRLAAAGGRNQQHALALFGMRQHGQLMATRAPAAGGKPAGETLRQTQLSKLMFRNSLLPA